MQGHKKIDIKKLDKQSNKRSRKRRQSFFKKVSELCALCDFHAAIVVFSPTNKLS
jgi:hypothetical protein